MASVKKRPSGQWRARYRDDTGREHSRHFTRKVDAQRWLDEIASSIVTGSYVDPRAGLLTFRDYAEDWRKAQVHRPSSRAHVETMLRRHAYPRFGDRPLSSIRPTEVQAWVAGLSGSMAPATVKVIHGIVAGIFKAAVRDRRLASSPCEGIRLPKVAPRRIEPFSTEQVTSLVNAVPERFRALVVLAAGTGLRQGEAFGLTVERVDFLRRTIAVEQQLVTVPGQPPTLAPPKTSASHRVVPLPQVVVDALAAHLAAFPEQGDLGLVFVNDGGEPLRRSWFSAHVWRPAVKAAELPTGTRFHDLRHFYASLLIRHGESVKVVQARLGHATAAETLDTYSHLWPDSEDRTRLAVDSVLGHSPEGSIAQ